MDWNPFAAAAVLLGVRESDRAEVVAVSPLAAPRGVDAVQFPEVKSCDDAEDGVSVMDGKPPVSTAAAILAEALDVSHEEARSALDDPTNQDAGGNASVARAAAALRKQMFEYRQDEWRWRARSGTRE